MQSVLPTPEWLMTHGPESYQMTWSAAHTMRPAPPMAWMWRESSRTVRGLLKKWRWVKWWCWFRVKNSFLAGHLQVWDYFCNWIFDLNIWTWSLGILDGNIWLYDNCESWLHVLTMFFWFPSGYRGPVVIDNELIGGKNHHRNQNQDVLLRSKLEI